RTDPRGRPRQGHRPRDPRHVPHRRHPPLLRRRHARPRAARLRGRDRPTRGARRAGAMARDPTRNRPLRPGSRGAGRERTDPMTNATLHTNHGAIAVELYGEDAPKTVENFVKLARDGFYDGVIFHRVIPDFMIQGGDPTGTGTGGPGYTFEDEFNQHKVERGALAMANAGPNTNGSQFFVVTAEATPWLDGKHTVFGRVTNGMDVVDEISKADTDAND